MRERVSGEGKLAQQRKIAHKACDKRDRRSRQKGVAHEVVAQHLLDIAP
jgi:hypothetical protein